jgi:predicted GNAT superfamily acetyltransferase
MTPTIDDEIVIRECNAIEEFDSCVRLQREVFGLPDIEISPRRHLIVSRQAGGWTLAAFAGHKIVGFVHHMAAVQNGDEIFGYSHMMAVDPEYQNKGVGAKLKWNQRARALAEGRHFIKWTWDPMQARNAHFNLNRLGVTVDSYAANFYGTDYPASPNSNEATGPGIDSDRLFARWQLNTRRVKELSEGVAFPLIKKPAATIEIPVNWTKLIREEPSRAKTEQLRVRSEFQNAFANSLICAAFERSDERPRYLLFEKESLEVEGVT